MVDIDHGQHYVSCQLCTMNVQFYCKPCGKRLCRECLSPHTDFNDTDHVVVPYHKRFTTVAKSFHDPEIVQIVQCGINSTPCIRFGGGKKLYIAANGVPLLKLFDTDGHLLDIYKPKNLVRFFSPSRDGFLYTYPGGIRKVNDVGDELILSHANSLKGIAFLEPEAIFVCNASPPNVVKYNTKGEKLLDIGEINGNNIYTYPENIAINGNGDICVTNVALLFCTNQRSSVIVVDSAGCYRFSYSAPQEQRFQPMDLCCDSNFHIIVADEENNKLHVIDREGRFLRYLIYDGIRNICSISIDTKDRLFVSQMHEEFLRMIQYWY